MVEARRIKKRAEVRKIDPWRQRWRAAAVEDGAGCRRIFEGKCWRQDTWVLEANGKQCEVKQAGEFSFTGIKVGLSYIGGARRCAISGMLVGDACSEYFGTNARSQERL